jgi:hypothetical protein
LSGNSPKTIQLRSIDSGNSKYLCNTKDDNITSLKDISKNSRVKQLLMPSNKIIHPSLNEREIQFCKEKGRVIKLKIKKE